MICSNHRCPEHIEPRFHTCPSEVCHLRVPRPSDTYTLDVQDRDPDAFFAAYDSAKKEHLQILLDNVDFTALKAIANRLHGNRHCTLPAVDSNSADERTSIDWKLASDQTGGQNCNLNICFEDGTEWIIRLRLEEPTVPPRAVQQRISDSEVHTLQFLARTNLPIPKIILPHLPAA